MIQSLRYDAFLALLGFFLLTLVPPPEGIAQTDIGSDTVNQYTAVNSIGASSVNVTDASAFGCGDYVLLIQMQGASYQTSGAPGDLNNLNNAGNYEFLYVQSAGSGTVSFSSSLQKSYTPSGNVQLVRVPQYQDATVTSTLSAQPWDGSTGGILAIDVRGTLTLNANIDVSGQGFRGGERSPTCNSSCNPPGGSCGGCAGSDNYYNLGVNAAGKGEAIAVETVSGEEAGRAKMVNGGGGGGTNEGGGGGGASFGAGGSGGNCNSSQGCGGAFGCFGCDRSRVAGRGGQSLSGVGFSSSNNRLFMGGGGGSGNNCNTSECFNDDKAAGHTGGGLILIQANTIAINGGALVADGEDGTVRSNNPSSVGAGGGGAGGAIMLDIQNYPATANSVIASVTGGRGEDADKNPFSSSYAGPGGGGGGGVVWVSQGSLPAAIDAQVSGGNPGVAYSSDPGNGGNRGASAGNAGGTRTGLSLVSASEPALTSGSIGGDQNFCASSADPATISNTTGATADLGTVNYQWFYQNSTSPCSAPADGNASPAGWTQVPSAGTSSAYDPSSGLSQSRSYVRRASDCRSNTAQWSGVSFVRVAPETRWTGAGGSDWFNSANWDNTVPDCDCDAVVTTNGTAPAIPGGMTANARDVTIQASATLTAQANAALQFCGDWTHNGSFTANTSTVVANGSAAQTLSGSALSVHNFRLANPNGLTLQTDLDVAQELDLTDGLITTNAHRVNVTNNAGNAVVNYSASSYINGNLRRAIQNGALFAFPVGTASSYQLAEVDYSSGSVGDYTALTAAFDPNVPSGSVPSVSECGNQGFDTWTDNGYWTLTGTSTGANQGTYDLVLYPNGNTVATGLDYTNTASTTFFKRPNSSGSWSLDGTCVPGASNLNSADGTVRVTRAQIATGFSDFAIAVDQNQPFPVRLSAFSASALSGDVRLDWQTSRERNASHFVVAHRSEARRGFERLLAQPAGGTRSRDTSYRAWHRSPAAGWHYYRLQQVDLNGRQHTLGTRQVYIEQANEVQLSLQPNPQQAHAPVHLRLYLPREATTRLRIVDMQGRVLAAERRHRGAGWHAINLAADQLSAGVYAVELIHPDGQQLHKRLFLQN